MQPCVTVFGSSRPLPGQDAYTVAFELGRLVALNGWRLCNGGYGGTMEAAACGAVSAGGHTIGIVCAAFKNRRPNRFLRETHHTRTLFERLAALIHHASAFVVLPGGTGTLLELAAVLELTRRGRAPRRPLVLVGSHWEPVIVAVRSEVRRLPGVTRVESVQAVIARLQTTFRRREKRGDDVHSQG